MSKQIKTSRVDWRFRLGVFLLIFTFICVIISVVLLFTANFTDQFGNYKGNGFWAFNHYSIGNFFLNWTTYDNEAITSSWLSHDFYQVWVSLIFILILIPITLFSGTSLIIRWWWKTRI